MTGEVQAAVAAAKTRFEGELNEIAEATTEVVSGDIKKMVEENLSGTSQAVADSASPDLSATQDEGSIEEGVYTITVQFDGLEVSPFIIWGIHHEQLLVTGGCIKAKGTQFREMRVSILVGVIGEKGNRQPLFDEFCGPPGKSKKQELKAEEERVQTEEAKARTEEERMKVEEARQN